MPIKMIITERGAGPVILCDYCDERIVRAADANYEWLDEGKEPGENTDIIFVHKKCSAANERTIGSHLSSEEMEHLFVYLARNLQLNWQEAADRVALIDSVGL